MNSICEFVHRTVRCSCTVFILLEFTWNQFDKQYAVSCTLGILFMWDVIFMKFLVSTCFLTYVQWFCQDNLSSYSLNSDFNVQTACEQITEQYTVCILLAYCFWWKREDSMLLDDLFWWMLFNCFFFCSPIMHTPQLHSCIVLSQTFNNSKD